MENITPAIYYKTVSQILRYVLTIGASYLLFVGVDKETNSEFVNVTVNILTPIVILGAVQIYSFLQKRTAEYRAYYALAAPPKTSMKEVDRLVAIRQPPSVSG